MNIPLTSRILFFLLKTHYTQIVATRLMRTTILQLREHLAQALTGQKVSYSLNYCKVEDYILNRNLSRRQDTIGYNMAALRQINRHQKTSKINEFYETEGLENADRLQAHLDESTKKRKRAIVKA